MVMNTIKSLLARTEASGATEAEITAAMQQVNRLLAKNDMTMDDIKDEDKTMTSGVNNKTRKRGAYVDICLSKALSTWLGVYVIFNNVNKGALEYYGEKCDVELFQYFRGMCEASCNRAWNEYKQATGQGKNRSDFQKSFYWRLAQKVKEMIDEREKYVSNGTSLMINRQAISKNYFFDQNPNVTVTRKSTTGYRDNSASQAGANAANKVNFNRPVNGSSGALMLS